MKERRKRIRIKRDFLYFEITSYITRNKIFTQSFNVECDNLRDK